eukprot:563632-Amorphochlora_amoeboformis.AAC.1
MNPRESSSYRDSGFSNNLGEISAGVSDTPTLSTGRTARVADLLPLDEAVRFECETHAHWKKVLSYDQAA